MIKSLPRALAHWQEYTLNQHNFYYFIYRDWFFFEKLFLFVQDSYSCSFPSTVILIDVNRTVKLGSNS